MSPADGKIIENKSNAMINVRGIEDVSLIEYEGIPYRQEEWVIPT